MIGGEIWALNVFLLTGKDMDQEDRSPLKHFVQAKKKIGDVFEQLLNYVQDGSQFVKGEMKSISYFSFFWAKQIFLLVISDSLSACLSDTCYNESLEHIANRDQLEEIEAYISKLAVIKDVLVRRHMKVAFFGRWVLFPSEANNLLTCNLRLDLYECISNGL